MALNVQMVRQPTAQCAAYTGLPGQLIVDTDVWSLHIHDGLTAGGFTTLMADHNLADLNNIPQARINLGLGSAAQSNVTDFDLAGSAAAAQAAAQAFATAADAVVLAAANAYVPTVALLKANNLSDVASAAAARTNLGLGSGSIVTFLGLTVGSNGLAVGGGGLSCTGTATFNNTVTILADAAVGHIVANGAGGGTFTATGFGNTNTISTRNYITNDGSGITMQCVSAGVLLSNGANSWVAASSREYKKNIQALPDGAIARIGKMAKVLFNYNEDADGTPLRVGSIYEDAVEVMPYITSYRAAEVRREIVKDKNGDAVEHVDNVKEHKGMSLELCVPDIMKAIDELAAENAAMRAEIELLKAAK